MGHPGPGGAFQQLEVLGLADLRQLIEPGDFKANQ